MTFDKPSKPYVTFDISKSLIDFNMKQKLRQVLRENVEAFSDSSGTLGKCDLLPARIPLKSDYVGNHIRPFRIPFHLRQIMEDKIAELEKQGVVRKAECPGPFQTPCFIIQKKSTPGAAPRYHLLQDNRFIWPLFCCNFCYHFYLSITSELAALA